MPVLDIENSAKIQAAVPGIEPNSLLLSYPAPDF